MSICQSLELKLFQKLQFMGEFSLSIFFPRRKKIDEKNAAQGKEGLGLKKAAEPHFSALRHPLSLKNPSLPAPRLALNLRILFLVYRKNAIYRKEIDILPLQISALLQHDSPSRKNLYQSHLRL